MRRTLGHVYVVAFLCVVAIYSWAYFGGRDFGGGRGGRVDFSPDTLEFRSQSELHSPIGYFPLYRSSFTYHHHQLADYLVAKGYWAPRRPANPGWFAYSSWSDRGSNGHTSLSDTIGRHREHWKKWTELNPEFAAWLWPRVLEQLRETRDSWSACWVGEVLSALQCSRSLDDFELLLRINRTSYDSYLSQAARARWRLPANLALHPVP